MSTLSQSQNSEIHENQETFQLRLTEDFDLRIFEGEVLPPEFLSLRRSVYKDETKFLADKDLITKNDMNGTHYLLYLKSTGELIGSTTMTPAMESDFPKYSGIVPEQLKKFALSSRSAVVGEFRKQKIFGLLLYLSFSDYRSRGFKGIVSYVEGGNIPGKKVLDYECLPLPPRTVRGSDGVEYQVYPLAEDINYFSYKSFESLPQAYKKWVSTDIMPRELEKTVLKLAENLYKSNIFFRMVNDKTLTRKQFIASVANMNSCYRWNTRILAQLVASTEDNELRNYYVEHLSSGIESDGMIENDLKYLNGRFEYVQEHMVPIAPIQQIMALQESLSNFYRDPVLFMAVHLGMQGFFAFLPKQFLSNLFECVKKWGCEPQKSCSFLTNQMSEDGGDEGQWKQSRKMVGKHLKNEKQMQIFLSTIHNIMKALDESYEQFVTDMPDFAMGLNLMANERLKENASQSENARPMNI